MLMMRILRWKGCHRRGILHPHWLPLLPLPPPKCDDGHIGGKSVAHNARWHDTLQVDHGNPVHCSSSQLALSGSPQESAGTSPCTLGHQALARAVVVARWSRGQSGHPVHSRSPSAARCDNLDTGNQMGPGCTQYAAHRHCNLPPAEKGRILLLNYQNQSHCYQSHCYQVGKYI